MIENATKMYQQLHLQAQSLRNELARAETLKGQLCDFIGSSTQKENSFSEYVLNNDYNLLKLEKINRTNSDFQNETVVNAFNNKLKSTKIDFSSEENWFYLDSKDSDFPFLLVRS